MHVRDKNDYYSALLVEQVDFIPVFLKTRHANHLFFSLK